MMDFIGIAASLVVLIILEIVLGIDNLVILSILSEKLPQEQRKKARRWGLTLSWITRLIILALAVDIIKLTKPLLTVSQISFSARDFFLMFGGGFLIWKATKEIHEEVVNESLVNNEDKSAPFRETFFAIMMQITIMDVIFSLDSVLTAVGLTSNFWVMAFAITCAIFMMIFASDVVSSFIKEYPTIKMLALSYLILIGMVLLADSFSFHIPRGYLYFAMGFSLAVEALNSFKKSRKSRNLK